MKSVLATAIVSAALSAAQKYSTSIYTDCTPLPDKTITSYNTATITYCPECEGGPGGYKHTTVWTTKLYDFCPTGLSAYTVTITESCTNATPTWSPGHPNYIPQGYTTSEMTCTVCGDTPITSMLYYTFHLPKYIWLITPLYRGNDLSYGLSSRISAGWRRRRRRSSCNYTSSRTRGWTMSRPRMQAT